MRAGRQDKISINVIFAFDAQEEVEQRYVVKLKMVIFTTLKFVPINRSV